MAWLQNKVFRVLFSYSDTSAMAFPFMLDVTGWSLIAIWGDLTTLLIQPEPVVAYWKMNGKIRARVTGKISVGVTRRICVKVTLRVHVSVTGRIKVMGG